MKDVSKRILRREREQRGWSRNYIAEQIGVDVITVGRWERGERTPHPHHRQKLCTLFAMNAQELGLLTGTSGEEVTNKATPANLAPTISTEPENSQALSTDASTTTIASPAVAEMPADVTGTSTPADDSNAAQQESASHIKSAPASSPLLKHRRALLLTALGGLGVFLGGSKLFFPAAPHAAQSTATSIAKMSFQRTHRLFDTNTDNWVNYMAWSPDAIYMALANGSNTISIWNVAKDTPVMYYPTLNLWVNDIAWSPDNIIAAATADKYAGSLQLWKFPERDAIFTLRRPYSLQSAAWSPDGKYLALSGRSPIVEVWDPFSARVVSQYSDATLGPHLLGMRRVKWSASGKLLASATDNGTIHVWDALTGKPRTSYYGHQRRAIDLAWSPDERYIVSGSADKTSQVWEALTGRSVLVYRGHKDAVEGVDWSPDGRYIASGSADHTAHIWEATTGKLLVCYQQSSTVEAVLWSAGGNTLSIATEKGGVEIWQK